MARSEGGGGQGGGGMKQPTNNTKYTKYAVYLLTDHLTEVGAA